MLVVQARLRDIQVSPAHSVPSSYLYGLLMGAGLALFFSLQSILKQFTWVFVCIAISILVAIVVLSVYEKWSRKRRLVGWQVFTQPSSLGIFTALFLWILLVWLWNILRP